MAAANEMTQSEAPLPEQIQKTNCSIFRFAIKDMFWLMTLATVAVAWWTDHRGLTYRIGDLDRQIIKAEGAVSKARQAVRTIGLELDEDSSVILFPAGPELSK
jgi:hypothetical protein